MKKTITTTEYIYDGDTERILKKKVTEEVYDPEPSNPWPAYTPNDWPYTPEVTCTTTTATLNTTTSSNTTEEK